jgi:hypothetical protein
MAENLLALLPCLNKQDRDNIRFAVWQLRPEARSLLAQHGILGIGFLRFDDVIDVLREAEDKGLLLPIGAALNTIRNLQSKRRRPIP